MSINIGPPETDDLKPRITVIGVGGAGGNAIANMIDAEIEGVDFIVANTDAQALGSSAAEQRIQLGPEITGGLGAGARPEVGKAAAEETVSEIEESLKGANMCFIAAGMGGGTGTGAAPVIAETARNMGVLTVGVVTKPFLFEGTRRMRAAEAGIEELQRHVDTLIVIPNQNLFLIAKAETTFKEAFELADEVLQQGVRSITDLMVMPGLINLDFADVKSVMEEMGKAMMGTGEGEGENRALEAAERAIANPLLDGVSMAGAKAVIISIIGGDDMKLLEVDEAANHIRELVDEDANIILGSAFNPDISGKIRISVVATGIEQDGQSAGPRAGSRDTSSFQLGDSRPPRRPVLDLTGDDDENGAFAGDADDGASDSARDGKGDDAAAEGLLASKATGDFSAPKRAPLDLSTMGAAEDFGHEDGEGNTGDTNDGEDDVEGIVDPLAGMRNRDPEPFELRGGENADETGGDNGSDSNGGIEPPAEDGGVGVVGDGGFGGSEKAKPPKPKVYSDDDDWGGDSDGARKPLNLSASETGTAGPEGGSDDGDELLLDADRLAEENAPVQQGGRRRGLVSGSESKAAGGGTLFERMANLSRGSNSDEDDGDDDEGGDDNGSGAINIPRFLGRQNNQ
ncbi:Cell division protein FtsZ [Alteripontixanthobacter maritimus]|uniref:Cell division protein FtsZ n=1 Tax=Alteripontixanthobacter maritimus TaxID=2161824 RepID=A0A369Q737_9SPHN|nr:cell division protein FtsZ [Alteripontixanthobacter maritimus]RDC59355.1 Cell division protein FtsZ [Alteripontixanthobacter maritimus]